MIDIDNVSFRYSAAEEESLHDVTIHINKGECVLLTGESGCGKTCVTRLVNTLIPHFYEGNMTGRVCIEGIDTESIQPHDLSEKIGSVFQNPRSQFFSLNTDSEIVFGMENKGVPYKQMQDRYQKTISELHIEKLVNRNIFDLSGGQKQTIAFASVYAPNPDIFVLDEPSSNLDPDAIKELQRLLLLIKSQGKTILISEHRLYFLREIVDRIIVMEQGRIKGEWTVDAFKKIRSDVYESLGLRSFTPTQLTLSVGDPKRDDVAVVQMKNLVVGYNKHPVTSKINFSVYPGEIVGIIGKNGCGKTTLARTLCGLQKEISGEILFMGKNVSWKKRTRSAYMVMQDPDYQLFTNSVYQEMVMATAGKKYYGTEKINDILKKLNLFSYKECHPMALSGGQKQRVAIGVAVLMDTEVIIFDEPTSGLDYKNMDSVAKILRTLSKMGKAILVISHDNELLMKICNRIIRMDADATTLSQ